MQLEYQNIVLRDMRESDIDDGIRWYTDETQWLLWDAPWETEEELNCFDPEQFRKAELDRLRAPKSGHRLRLEIDAGGVHIGSVSAYCIDEDFNWKAPPAGEDQKGANWAFGIDICESAYWSGGWGAQALRAFLRYWLDAGYQNLYVQTWSGNFRMVGLAKKLGFVECCRKPGIRQVRGGAYDGLTFRLDPERFCGHTAGGEGRAMLDLYIPNAEDMWFVQRMQADPATMSYNAGWDVSYPGYHPDTGCIDFPESEWEKKHADLVGHEPERFYALVREVESGAFVGEVNFYGHGRGMGVLLYAPYRGKGYGLPALELLLRHAFVVCGLSSLRNDFEDGRDAGLAVHLAAGFRRTGVGSANRFGQPVRLLQLELTREEYFSMRANGSAPGSPEKSSPAASPGPDGLPGRTT